MKLKNSIIISTLDDGFVAIDSKVNESRNNCMVKLNKTTKDVMELLKKEMTIDEIVEVLISKYEVEENKVKNDILKIINDLESIGYLEN